MVTRDREFRLRAQSMHAGYPYNYNSSLAVPPYIKNKKDMDCMSLGGCASLGLLDEFYDDEWYMETMLSDPSGSADFAAVYGMPHLERTSNDNGPNSQKTPSPVQSAPRPGGDTTLEYSEDEHSPRQTCDGGALPHDTICENPTVPALPVVVTERPLSSPPAVIETPSVPPRLKIDVTSSASTVVNTWAAPVRRHRICVRNRGPRRLKPAEILLLDGPFAIPIAQAPRHAPLPVRPRHSLGQEA
ncbi:hypothetical protein C8Q74DRAFT_1222850 [Fomes fomentarius]|nr:hypothetical protein C8Q74DRAFT_1222850 [Fomes fomentarius]